MKQDEKLLNGIIGFINDIIYEVETSPSRLPMFVLVYFGAEYNGKKLFPNEPRKKLGSY